MLNNSFSLTQSNPFLQRRAPESLASDLPEARFWNVRPVVKMYQRLMNNDEARDKAVTGLSNLGLGFVKGWQRNNPEQLNDVVRMNPKQGNPVDLAEPNRNPE